MFWIGHSCVHGERYKNRLGYGGGYYDRFLSVSNSLKIAVAYDEQIIQNLPTEVHDIKMDLIITPTKIIK